MSIIETKESAGTRDCWHEWPRSCGLMCEKLPSHYTKLSLKSLYMMSNTQIWNAIFNHLDLS